MGKTIAFVKHESMYKLVYTNKAGIKVTLLRTIKDSAPGRYEVFSKAFDEGREYDAVRVLEALAQYSIMKNKASQDEIVKAMRVILND